MTAIPHPLTPHGHDDAHAHGHGHHELGFLKKYIFSTDHKIIGIQFLFMGLMFFVVGGLLAMLVRWQLAWPSDPSASGADPRQAHGLDRRRACRRTSTPWPSRCTRRS